MKKRATKTTKTPRKGVEFQFKIDAYTPETIPMARLAEYMTHIAEVLGETNAVHFLRLERGSTAVISLIEHEAAPKVRVRTDAVRRGDAPRDAIRAYQKINGLLRADNGVGQLSEKRRGTVLKFPGRETTEERFGSVRQQGSVDGQVIRVGGTDETVPVLLQSEGEQIVGCHANKALAKELGGKLFEYVRLYGNGRWTRDGDGLWSLVDFKITSFEVLQEGTLSAALAKVRALGTDWVQDAYHELESVRRGPPGVRDGGH